METSKPDNGRKVFLNFGQGAQIGDEDILHCPDCGSSYLHHGAVTVYSRKEDNDHTLETRVADRVAESGIVPSKLSSNPSSRRDGISIAFSCEMCPARLELTFAQHKGQTELVWRRPRSGVAA